MKRKSYNTKHKIIKPSQTQNNLSGEKLDRETPINTCTYKFLLNNKAYRRYNLNNTA